MSEDTDHLLVVDDDREICRLLENYLQQSGYRVTTVPNGAAMRKALAASHIDLIILDLMLPGEDGLTLCRNLRRDSKIPVLFLSAKGEEIDRIVGLEMGADDYLSKPFNPRELLARIKSILRRTRMLPNAVSPSGIKAYRFGHWTLDLRTRNLLASDGLVVPLSGLEFRLLNALLEHAETVLSRDQLLDMVSKKESVPFDRSIDVLIGRLRKRLRDDGKSPVLIKTVRSQGYVLAEQVERL